MVWQIKTYQKCPARTFLILSIAMYVPKMVSETIFVHIHCDRKYQKCPARTFLVRFGLADHSWSILKYAPK